MSVLFYFYPEYAQPEADSMVAAAAANERALREARRRDCSASARREHAAALAPRYRNELLGELRVERAHSDVRFRFAAWDMPVASRVGAGGAVEFSGAIPSPPFPFVAGRSAAGRTLTLRDAQNEYVFTETQ